MFLLADVHVAPVITIPPAIAVVVAAVWYWNRLGRPDVPVSRKKIRRFSIVLIIVLMPVLVSALSFRDPTVDREAYVYSWMISMGILLGIMGTAIADALNSVRLHGKMLRGEVESAASELARVMKERAETGDVDESTAGDSRASDNVGGRR
ncbi:MAG TPA: hypothetical protein VG711_04215 [Phycisphaerales bacterium]|nr:hypothetical protein [Phycisphaerales bacterium]